MHTYIVGMTGSGKSTLARLMAEARDRDGWPLVIYDSTASTVWPESADTYDDPGKFLAACSRRRNAYVIIDEAIEVVDRTPSTQWLHRKGRAIGLNVVTCTQFPSDMPPSVRSQASICYLFAIQRKFAEPLIDEFIVQDSTALYDKIPSKPMTALMLPRFGTPRIVTVTQEKTSGIVLDKPYTDLSEWT